jgi:hypothetical protein
MTFLMHAHCFVCGAQTEFLYIVGVHFIPVGAKFPAPVQAGPGAHPASYIMGSGFLSRGLNDRGMTLTTNPIYRRG